MPASGYKLEILRKRAEFLAVAANGKRWVAPGFILQIGGEHAPSPTVRYGITASKKVGNAVVRNRAKRRLRALAAHLLTHATPQNDYVLVARTTTPTYPFSSLQEDLAKGLKRLKLWQETPVNGPEPSRDTDTP